jgi:hypothetical protein
MSIPGSDQGLGRSSGSMAMNVGRSCMLYWPVDRLTVRKRGSYDGQDSIIGKTAKKKVMTGSTSLLTNALDVRSFNHHLRGRSRSGIAHPHPRRHGIGQVGQATRRLCELVLAHWHVAGAACGDAIGAAPQEADGVGDADPQGEGEEQRRRGAVAAKRGDGMAGGPLRWRRRRGRREAWPSQCMFRIGIEVGGGWRSKRGVG